MITNVDDLLLNSHNPKLIESQIIDYIMTLREDGLAYATITFLIAPLITFYTLNDVVLNKRKISRYFGEYKKVVKDRAYTAEEIYKALQTADQRMKVIILLMLSTGERIGSLPELTLGNLTKIEDYGIYKVTTFKAILQDVGFIVNAYEDPLIALSDFKPRFYDLIILDIKMPKLNGFELYAEIQKRDSQVKMCFVTADEMYYNEVRKQGEQQYCVLDTERFLRKPISSADLLKRVEKDNEWRQIVTHCERWHTYTFEERNDKIHTLL
jgi:CheY-like chemotaxis protein